MSRQLLKHGSMMLIANGVAGVLAYLFNALVARRLGPADFGTLGALLAIFMVVSVPFGGLSLAVTAEVARLRPTGDRDVAQGFLWRSLQWAAAASVGCVLVFALVTPAVDTALHVDAPLAVVVLGVYVALSLVTTVPSAGLRGLERFPIAAAALVLEATVRLVAGILLMALAWSLVGALAAYCLGMALAGVLSLCALGLHRAPAARVTWSAENRDYLVRSTIASIGLALMVSVDMIVVKHYLPPVTAGNYAAATTLLRVLPLITASFATVMFPMVAGAGTSATSPRRSLLACLACTTAASGGIIAICFVAGRAIIGAVFGPAFAEAGEMLPGLAVAWSLIGITTILVNYGLARRVRGLATVALVTSLIQSALLLAFHSDFAQIVTVLWASQVLASACLAAWISGLRLRPRPTLAR